MTVWIVELCFPYEGCDVIAVCATQEAAEQVIAKKKKADGYDDSLHATEHEVIE